MRTLVGAPFLALLLAVGTASADDPMLDGVTLDASSFGLRLELGPTFHIGPDGRARLDFDTGPDRHPAFTFELQLDAREQMDLRRRIDATRFFQPWGDPRKETDQDHWKVTLTVETRTRTREAEGQPEFDGVEQVLGKLARQGAATRDLRAGRKAKFRADDMRSMFRPESLVLELVDCAVKAADPSVAADAALSIAEVAPAAEFASHVREILSRLDEAAEAPPDHDGRAVQMHRDAVLGRWAEELRDPSRAAQRLAFAPIAMHEVEREAASWPAKVDRHRVTLDALLAAAVRAKQPNSVELAERILRRGHAAPGALGQTGLAGIAIAHDLLTDPTAENHASGAAVAQELVEFLPALPGRRDALVGAERSAFSAKFESDVLAELDRLQFLGGLAAEAETQAFHLACLATQLAWRIRDASLAEARAADVVRAAAENTVKACVAPPTPSGGRSIAGRLVAENGAPLAGWTIVARRLDDPAPRTDRVHGTARSREDGSFSIDRLIPGSFRVTAFAEPVFAAAADRDNASTLDGVVSGTPDLFLLVVRR
jgi:hypothetical protein